MCRIFLESYGRKVGAACFVDHSTFLSQRTVKHVSRSHLSSQNFLFLLVSECEASTMLPLECQYLNKSALTTLVGPLTPPVKHFQLKRKPKSATLRAELLQKCKPLNICKGPLQLQVCPKLKLCIICHCCCSH